MRIRKFPTREPTIGGDRRANDARAEGRPARGFAEGKNRGTPKEHFILQPKDRAPQTMQVRGGHLATLVRDRDAMPLHSVLRAVGQRASRQPNRIPAGRLRGIHDHPHELPQIVEQEIQMLLAREAGGVHGVPFGQGDFRCRVGHTLPVAPRPAVQGRRQVVDDRRQFAGIDDLGVHYRLQFILKRSMSACALPRDPPGPQPGPSRAGIRHPNRRPDRSGSRTACRHPPYGRPPTRR